MQINATELKTRLGRYLTLSIKEPVFIEKSGNQHAVLISSDLYNKLIALEDKYWGELALQAENDEPFTGDAMAELLNIATEKGINLDNHKAVETYKNQNYAKHHK
ncbi:Phd_YefM protein [Beggiatoa alba B18LD]|uniref:Antitoxin n=1 Tax=Beggiatoa alba B18LD TaxID=395493 RepID=I3CBE1_9GAMM|nr:type II toxin-antitoxin system Phd/YefM family antitoxin [Beggiatoa alba]EIJ40934.1 Phd_YefM protein [Beggiatoa alba B18LD]